MKISTIIALGIVGAAGYYIATGSHDAETQARLDKVCFDKHGEMTTGANSYFDNMCTMTDAYKEAQEAIKVAAKAKAEQEQELTTQHKCLGNPKPCQHMLVQGRRRRPTQ